MAAITFTPKKGAAEETSEVAATPETKVAAVEPEQTVVIDLKRWIHIAKQGWYSGDHQVHAAGCAA